MILNIYTLNSKASKYVKQKFMELQWEINILQL